MCHVLRCGVPLDSYDWVVADERTKSCHVLSCLMFCGGRLPADSDVSNNMEEEKTTYQTHQQHSNPIKTLNSMGKPGEHLYIQISYMQCFRNMLLHHRLGKVSRMSGFELGADGYKYIYIYVHVYVYIYI